MILDVFFLCQNLLAFGSGQGRPSRSRKESRRLQATEAAVSCGGPHNWQCWLVLASLPGGEGGIRRYWVSWEGVLGGIGRYWPFREEAGGYWVVLASWEGGVLGGIGWYWPSRPGGRH